MVARSSQKRAKNGAHPTPWFGIEGNCRSLGFPGFPVESCGFGQLHVVLFRENHISGVAESCEVGNPGTLGMTKGRVGFPLGIGVLRSEADWPRLAAGECRGGIRSPPQV